MLPSARVAPAAAAAAADAQEGSAPPADDIFELQLRRRTAGQSLGLTLDPNNVVVGIDSVSPASESGALRLGDQIVAVGSELCTSERRVCDVLSTMPPSETVDLMVLRRPVARPTTARRVFNVEDAADSGRKESAARRGAKSSAWKGFARGRLGRRLEAARQLREAGNAAFADGKFAAALREYDFAVDLFRFEVANLARDQREAELGDTGRGLGSDDLPRIQAVRVPCLLNACACLLRLAKAGGGGVDADGGGAGGAIAVTEGVRVQLLRVLDLSDEVLKASPPAPARAKAHYRRAPMRLVSVALSDWAVARVRTSRAAAIRATSVAVRARCSLRVLDSRSSPRRASTGFAVAGASVRGSHGKRTLLKGCAWYPIFAPRPHCAEAPLAERKRRRGRMPNSSGVNSTRAFDLPFRDSRARRGRASEIASGRCGDLRALLSSSTPPSRSPPRTRSPRRSTCAAARSSQCFLCAVSSYTSGTAH